MTASSSPCSNRPSVGLQTSETSRSLTCGVILNQWPRVWFPSIKNTFTPRTFSQEEKNTSLPARSQRGGAHDKSPQWGWAGKTGIMDSHDGRTGIWLVRTPPPLTNQSAHWGKLPLPSNKRKVLNFLEISVSWSYILLLADKKSRKRWFLLPSTLYFLDHCYIL